MLHTGYEKTRIMNFVLQKRYFVLLSINIQHFVKYIHAIIYVNLEVGNFVKITINAYRYRTRMRHKSDLIAILLFFDDIYEDIRRYF